MTADHRTLALITVDVECSVGGAFRPGGKPLGPERYVYGRVGGRQHGVRRIMEILEEHGLRGVFFTEPLCARVFGSGWLRDFCQEALSRGHDVQLHLHPVWREVGAGGPPRGSDDLADHPPAEQRALLEEGLERLAAAGAPGTCAFRAGNFGADARTSALLEALGLRFSSNYNAAYPERAARLGLAGPLNDLHPAGPVTEFPITCFADGRPFRREGRRPLQVCAASRAEIGCVLAQAPAAGMRAVTALLHSFELLERVDKARHHLIPSPRSEARFRFLCAELARRASEYRVCTFAELAAGLLPLPPPPEEQFFPRSTGWNWLRRCAEQAHTRARIAAARTAARSLARTVPRP